MSGKQAEDQLVYENVPENPLPPRDREREECKFRQQTARISEKSSLSLAAALREEDHRNCPKDTFQRMT